MYLSRGDRANFSIIFKDGDTPYTFKVGDVLRLTIAKDFKTETSEEINSQEPNDESVDVSIEIST